MPRLNYGTLLENVVLAEVARLSLARLRGVDPLVLATSFAMPPLTQCWAKKSEVPNAPRFNSQVLHQLASRSTANGERNRKLAQFDSDEKDLFPRSIVFEHGNYQTGVKLRWPADEADDVVRELEASVRRVWANWQPGMTALTVHLDGLPAA